MDMRKVVDHSEVVSIVVVDVGVGSLALPKAILRQTPRHLVVLALEGYCSEPFRPICALSYILFMAIISSPCLVHIRYKVQASRYSVIWLGSLTNY